MPDKRPWVLVKVEVWLEMMVDSSELISESGNSAPRFNVEDGVSGVAALVGKQGEEEKEEEEEEGEKEI